MHNTSYEWSVPGFSNIIQGQGNSSIAVDWGQDNGEVNVALDNNCVNNELSRQVFDPNKQYPYPDPLEAHLLPGRIKAVNYDYGGEGVAYHDLGSLNQGDGPRQDEGVDTEYMDSGSYVGWINSGEWLEYSIEVEDTCWVSISVEVASDGGGGPVQLKVNGQEKLDEFDVPDTEGWTNFTILEPGIIKLTPEDTVLRIEAAGGGFNIAEMIFTETEATDIQQTKGEDGFLVYPNPVDNELIIKGGRDIESVEIWNVPGEMVKKEFCNSSGELRINASDLSSGIYVIRIITSKGTIVSKRFVKR